MSRTMMLASPLIEGDDVRALQAALDSSRYGDFYDGERDGVFGELTAIACRKARYWLGYPAGGRSSWKHGVAGAPLVARLTGAKPLPASYAKRRASRLAAHPERPLRERALAVAIPEIGVNESPPGSNRQKFGAFYGADGVPWCAIFDTWAYETGGPSEAFDRHAARWAYVPFLVADARQGRFNVAVTTRPKPGDVVCYRFGSNVWKHTGLFEKWLVEGQTFSAIEGNTSQSSDDNGGEVQRRERRVADGVVFVHVGR